MSYQSAGSAYLDYTDTPVQVFFFYHNFFFFLTNENWNGQLLLMAENM